MNVKNKLGISLVTIVFLLLGQNVQASTSITLANSHVPTDQLTKRQVKALFLGKTTVWSNNSSVKLCYLNSESLEQDFTKPYLGKSVRQFELFWMRQLFSGGGNPPMAAKSAAEVNEFVENNEGAICYLPQADQNVGGAKKVIDLTD